MFIKIYFGNKPLFLTDAIDNDLEEYARHDDTVIIEELSAPAVNTVIHELKQQQIHAAIMVHHDLDELKTRVFRKFQMVPAAGGLVMNEKDEVLMIFRRGHWDLPKGKLDPGETIEACAIREVMEETGLSNVELLKPLVITYHTYDESGHHLLKDSHWYLMKSDSTQNLVPQQEEQISQIKWVNKADVPAYAQRSFPSIVDVLKTAGYL